MRAHTLSFTLYVQQWLNTMNEPLTDNNYAFIKLKNTTIVTVQHC